MDGIEATAAIRAWEKERQESYDRNLRTQIPIIALTANAVVGMREMFIENGFNDFLAKPIDVSKLDEMLDRWLPKKKREKGTGKNSNNDDNVSGSDSPLRAFPDIPGIDVKKGITMTGGTAALYRQVLTAFRKDAEERLPLLRAAPAPDALAAFTTQVHALKSASASMGAGEFSAKAAALETAGKAGDMAFIEKQLPAFVKQLSELVDGIRVMEESHIEKHPAAGGLGSINPLLRALAGALKDEKVEEIDRILGQLARLPLDNAVKTAIDKISDEVLIAEYAKAAEILKELV